MGGFIPGPSAGGGGGDIEIAYGRVVYENNSLANTYGVDSLFIDDNIYTVVFIKGHFTGEPVVVASPRWLQDVSNTGTLYVQPVEEFENQYAVEIRPVGSSGTEIRAGFYFYAVNHKSA